jgi:hypothetical protein
MNALCELDRAANQRTQETSTRYRTLVHQVADDRPIDADGALEILRSAGKSREDLQADVTKFRRLRELQSQRQPVPPLKEAVKDRGREHQAAIADRRRVIEESARRVRDAEAAWNIARSTVAKQERINAECAQLERDLGL